MISNIQHKSVPLDESFLRQKYEVERLSIAQISALTFSARIRVMKALREYGIPVREAGKTVVKRPGFGLPFGMRIVNRQQIPHQREQSLIRKMVELRGEGFTYTKIADRFNTLGIYTKTNKGKWSAKTIHQILKRIEGHSILDVQKDLTEHEAPLQNQIHYK